MAVKLGARFKSHSFSGTSSAVVGHATSYTSLRDLMPNPGFFACYNRKAPQLLDLKQLRVRDRLVEQAARAYLHPEKQAGVNRQRSSTGFYNFLRIITVPFQHTHSLLQAFFHDASTWLRRICSPRRFATSLQDQSYKGNWMPLADVFREDPDGGRYIILRQ